MYPQTTQQPHQRRQQQGQQAVSLHELQRSLMAEDLRQAPPRGRGQQQQPRSGPPQHQHQYPRRGDNVATQGWDLRDPRDARDPYDEGPLVSTRADRGVGLDIHEILKQEAFGAPQAACDDHFEKNRPCPAAVYGISDQYMVLDTFSKVQTSRVEQGEFQWNFMVQGVTGDEVIGVHDRIDTVIEIQLGSFCLAIPPEVPYVLAEAPTVTPSGTNRLVLVHNNANGLAGTPTLVPNNPLLGHGQYPPSVLVPPSTFLVPWVNNPYSQLPFCNRLTIQLREAGLQSFSDRNGARHHFEFVVSHLAALGSNPTMLQATPLAGSWDSFIFTDPLKDVHGLTLVFRNPDVPIRFLPDCFYEVRVVSDGAASPGPFLRFDIPAHGLNAGDRVYVSGFKSGVGVLDTYVNRPEGHVIGGDPGAPPLGPGTALSGAPAPIPDAFWLDPAVSIIDFSPAPSLPQVVMVCIAKRRMRIPIRLRRIVQRLTNYIAP
jgi:hypothetical protein